MEIFVIFVFNVWLTKIIQIIARSKVRYEPEFGVKSTHTHTSYSNLNNFFLFEIYQSLIKSKAFLKSKAIICSSSASSSPSPVMQASSFNESVKFSFSLAFYVRKIRWKLHLYKISNNRYIDFFSIHNGIVVPAGEIKSHSHRGLNARELRVIYYLCNLVSY